MHNIIIFSSNHIPYYIPFGNKMFQIVIFIRMLCTVDFNGLNSFRDMLFQIYQIICSSNILTRAETHRMYCDEECDLNYLVKLQYYVIKHKHSYLLCLITLF